MATSRQSKYKVVKEYNEPIEAPDLTAKSWLRWIWKQLTSMKVALFLLLLLAAASVPGSIYPQRSADPNGVALYFKNNPETAKWLDRFQLFDVYSSNWFSSIYILLFISLIGCVLPRVAVHYKALRSDPPEAPTNLSRLPEYKKLEITKTDLSSAVDYFKENKYRVVVTKNEIRAEKGYLRETGNLFFHLSLLGVLISVGLGGALNYSGQRVLVEGETFVNNEAGFDTLSKGFWFDTKNLTPFSLKLDSFMTTYDYKNPANYAKPLDFRATVTSTLCSSQDYPNKTIRIVTSPIGGGNDFPARLIAAALTAPMGQQIVVDNRPTVLIADIVAKSPPDGYTLLLTGSAHWIGPLVEKMNYDAVRDFAAVTLTSTVPLALVAHPSFAAGNAAELIAQARARPGAIDFTSTGVGSAQHLAMEFFIDLAGIRMNHVPHKAMGQAIADVARARHQLDIDPIRLIDRRHVRVFVRQGTHSAAGAAACAAAAASRRFFISRSMRRSSSYIRSRLLPSHRRFCTWSS